MTNNTQMLQLPPAIVVGELAQLLGVTPIDVIKELMKNGVMATINQVVDFDTAAVVAADLGFTPEEQAPVVAEKAKETASNAADKAKQTASSAADKANGSSTGDSTGNLSASTNSPETKHI